MRLHWLRDEHNKKLFNVKWADGKSNQTDYFTKHHPTTHHRKERSKYVYDNFKILEQKINMICENAYHNTERVC